MSVLYLLQSEFSVCISLPVQRNQPYDHVIIELIKEAWQDMICVRFGETIYFGFFSLSLAYAVTLVIDDEPEVESVRLRNSEWGGSETNNEASNIKLYV